MEFGFGIIASAPVFEINNLVLQDDGLDGVWDAGEVVTINVELVNSGSAGLVGIQVLLSKLIVLI